MDDMAAVETPRITLALSDEDELLHLTCVSSLPYTLCCVLVIEKPAVAEGPRCPLCWEGSV